jgi:hypothetical protein
MKTYDHSKIYAPAKALLHECPPFAPVRRKPCAGSRSPEAVRRKLCAGSRAPEAVRGTVRREPCAGRHPEAVRRKPCAECRAPEAVPQCAVCRAPYAVPRKPCAGSRAPGAVCRKPCVIMTDGPSPAGPCGQVARRRRARGEAGRVVRGWRALGPPACFSRSVPGPQARPCARSAAPCPLPPVPSADRAGPSADPAASHDPHDLSRVL